MFYTATSFIKFATMVLVIVLLLVNVPLTFCKGNTTDYYTAAVVEYATPITWSLSADEVMIRNANSYVEYMKNASLQQVDIIVFPESGLSHNNAERAVEVPSPSIGIAPCDANSTFHQALVILSCGSRNYGLYTVVNLKEIYYNTSTNDTALYNTNVAFDRNGTVVGRYRKYNPYGEAVNKTATPEYSIFKTDFDVEFGMFTCFDIDFKEPALVMAMELGVRHFVFPNCWSSELPFLTAIQTQWGWSFSLNVVLLAAGCNFPLAGGSGSGIYLGNQGIQTYMQTNSLTSRMIIATVPKDFNPRSNNTEMLDIQLISSHANVFSGNVKSKFDTDSSTESSGASDQSNSTLVMLRDYLDVYQTKLLIDPDEISGLNTSFTNGSVVSFNLTTEVTLCQNDFCCYFQVDLIDSFSTTPPAQLVRGDDFSSHVYKLAVFDGVRSYGGGVATGGVQVCGIIPCLNNSISSCGLRADSSSSPATYYVENLYKVGTTFKRIEITSVFTYNNTFIFPSVLVMGENDEFGQLLGKNGVMFDQYDPFNQTVLCSMRIEETMSNLVSAAVYARQFDRDGEPRTEPSTGNPLVVSHNLLLIVFIVLRVQFH